MRFVVEDQVQRFTRQCVSLRRNLALELFEQIVSRPHVANLISPAASFPAFRRPQRSSPRVECISTGAQYRAPHKVQLDLPVRLCDADNGLPRASTTRELEPTS